MAKRSKPEIVDVEALRAALAAAEARADHAEAEAAAVKAQLSGDVALIAHLRLEIAKLTRTLYGQRSERTQRLIDQYELQLEELEASAAADALAAEKAAAKAAVPAPMGRRKPSRQPFPAQLPRVRVVVPAPTACPCCGDMRLSKMGEDVTETLEVVPRQWTVIQTVRERFSCRACESVTQPPAPFHAIPRGWAGPSLLAMVLFEKYGQHVPLNRQAERYAREGVPLSLSTLADQVGACAGVLEPLFRLIERHVMAAGRLHGDDTTVPVLAKGKTSTGRVWVYVRDDRPFGGADPPAAVFHFSPDRRGEHPQAHLANWTGVLQADAYGGYGKLYEGERKPAPIVEAACRVGEDVSIPAPHRPGRADFPHPVLRAHGSLTERRTCGRSGPRVEGSARAWLGSAATADCYGGRAARAISSRPVRSGGDTTGSAGRCR